MPLLPRSTPAASGMSSRAVGALLDQLEARSVECHSLMVVHRGHVVVEGWWTPYSAERVHLLYSLTKSFTSVAVGLTIADGLLSLDDRVVDVLPDHVPADVSAQGRRITVHHLLSMTAGHDPDSLDEAWRLEPGDLVRGFLRVPFANAEGTRHTYDNSTTYILARMVERVTGRSLPEFLDERLFQPMGIEGAEWDRVASGAAFGFHGLHLTTEAVAAFGELLLRGGVWGDRQLVPREWLDLATSPQIETLPLPNWSENPDFLRGYGYQFWISRHGYHGRRLRSVLRGRTVPRTRHRPHRRRRPNRRPARPLLGLPPTGPGQPGQRSGRRTARGSPATTVLHPRTRLSAPVSLGARDDRRLR
ncbi:serine hydrolase domain-containing protein [Kribbella sp. NPDC051718]|uniref:serine hydrolase domain-containing protein n=1 Tax=Kribbella sp. NPDC051718 TaxID=3155168 RepID=UPI00342A4025